MPARTVGWMALRALFYAVSVVVLLMLAAVVMSGLPLVTITTTPETEIINKVGLDMQSLKYLLFENELSQLYAPSPPPSVR